LRHKKPRLQRLQAGPSCRARLLSSVGTAPVAHDSLLHRVQGHPLIIYYKHKPTSDFALYAIISAFP
jgi:hypothetical protein